MAGERTGERAEAIEAARVRALRAARAQALARRRVSGTPDEAGPDALESFLVCACGNERYGLPMASVAQVLPARACTPLPNAPPALVGLLARAGTVVSVLDLATLLGRGARRAAGAGKEADEGHHVVLRGPVALALAVDRVLAVGQRAAPEGAPDGGFGNEAVSGYAAVRPGDASSGDFLVIDLPRLLRPHLP